MTGLTNRVYIKCNGNGRLYMKVTTNEPQLDTVSNVSASGTTVSWDAVKNAESYDIYVDNMLYENTTGQNT